MSWMHTVIVAAVLFLGAAGAFALPGERSQPSRDLAQSQERMGRYRVSRECMRELERLGRPADARACRIKEPIWRRLRR
jgi:hypothetical protein